jgi:hypothetical protein
MHGLCERVRSRPVAPEACSRVGFAPAHRLTQQNIASGSSTGSRKNLFRIQSRATSGASGYWGRNSRHPSIRMRQAGQPVYRIPRTLCRVASRHHRSRLPPARRATGSTRWDAMVDEGNLWALATYRQLPRLLVMIRQARVASDGRGPSIRLSIRDEGTR